MIDPIDHSVQPHKELVRTHPIEQAEFNKG